jgi:hypothetical protein
VLISRADFVFTIGYEGNVAVVDGTLKKRYGSLSTEQLVEQGLFKQALCSAIYEAQAAGAGGPDLEAFPALQQVLDAYNQQTDRKVTTLAELMRLFGAFEVPEGVSRVMII